MKRPIFGLILLLFTSLFFYRVKIGDLYVDIIKEPIPIAINYQEILNVKEVGVDMRIPEEYNLSVPFIIQAPSANWDLPYQEACEEAAIIMLHYYMQNKELDAELANREILDLVDWQNDYFGDYKDTTIAETADIIRQYWKYNVEIIDNPTVRIIKEHIISGRPVIAPFYGRALDNPYYSGEGPLYHMMVIKGYVDDKFITNDPGTKRGEDYMYDYDIIMSAMHDWNDGDVENGLPGALIIK